MRYLLIYDIAHDGVRTKVADVCLDYGLQRIQYSAFLGELSQFISENSSQKSNVVSASTPLISNCFRSMKRVGLNVVSLDVRRRE